MSSIEKHETTTELIDEPTEVDVLCGRGGMSNHHPGNEWYRRLIRGNRPLYRACPKHTKLLVSKAIVQAVEQQGGRFLEKDKRSNKFIQVSYKRAVDKTSQGLRERDRDDGESDDESYDAEGRAKKRRMEVPDAFSGRNKTPDMSELATVAIGMTNRSNNSPSQSGFPGVGPMRRGKVEVVVGKKSRSNLLADDDEDYSTSRGDDNNNNMICHQQITVKIPPALHANQTSTYRLLDQTNPRKKSNTADTLQETSPSLLSTFSQAYGVPSAAGAITSASPPFNPAVPGIYWVNPASSQNPIAFLPVPMSDSAPPPLSRLTTQVSDWLTSFWPLNKDTPSTQSQDGSSNADGSENLPKTITNKIKIPAPLGNDKPRIRTIPPPSKRIVHMQQRVKEKKLNTKEATGSNTNRKRSVIELTHVPTERMEQVMSQQQDQLRAWQEYQAQQAAIQLRKSECDFDASAGQNHIDSAKPSGHRARKRSSQILHDLTSRNRERLASAVSGTDDDASYVAAAPTELEQSVSATLLKLASGRLESGITTFFEEQDSVDLQTAGDSLAGSDEHGNHGESDPEKVERRVEVV